MRTESTAKPINKAHIANVHLREVDATTTDVKKGVQSARSSTINVERDLLKAPKCTAKVAALRSIDPRGREPGDISIIGPIRPPSSMGLESVGSSRCANNRTTRTVKHFNKASSVRAGTNSGGCSPFRGTSISFTEHKRPANGDDILIDQSIPFTSPVSYRKVEIVRHLAPKQPDAEDSSTTFSAGIIVPNSLVATSAATH
jgi:hypothetical protein